MSDETRTTAESLADGLAYAIARAPVPAKTDTARIVADRLAPLVIESGYLAALPVATAGPEPGNIVGGIIDAVGDALDNGDCPTVGVSHARRRIIERFAPQIAALRGAAAQADGGEPGLDVDRLTRAMVVSFDTIGETIGETSHQVWRKRAAILAAEYARIHRDA